MAKNKPAVNIVQPQPPSEPIAAEILAASIVDIAAGMKKLDAGRLKRRALVILIAESSGVRRGDVEAVLNSMESLETSWLKPAPAAATRKGG